MDGTVKLFSEIQPKKCPKMVNSRRIWKERNYFLEFLRGYSKSQFSKNKAKSLIITTVINDVYYSNEMATFSLFMDPFYQPLLSPSPLPPLTASKFTRYRLYTYSISEQFQMNSHWRIDYMASNCAKNRDVLKNDAHKNWPIENNGWGVLLLPWND